MTFGQQIAHARQVLGLTQAALAVILDTTSQTVSNWECERGDPWPKVQVKVLSKLLELQMGLAGGRTTAELANSVPRSVGPKTAAKQPAPVRQPPQAVRSRIIDRI